MANTPDHGVQANEAGFLLVVDLFPFGEVFDPRRHAADSSLGAVRQDHESVVPERLWNGVLIVGQILLVGQLDVLVGRLQFR